MTMAWLQDPAMRGLDIDDPRATDARRELIRRKVFLQRLYDEWYRWLAATVPTGPGRVLELGSGAGFFRDVMPEAIASEILPSLHVSLRLDAQQLPFAENSLRAVVMVDVLHHVPDVRQFFRDATRTVRPGGRIAMIEPWVSPWSRLIYRGLHHEPFVPDAATWAFPKGGPLSAANMALPWIVFVRDRAAFEREFPEWRIVTIEPVVPFRYLLSGGVSLRALMPGWSFGFWRALERALVRWLPQMSLFARIVIERVSPEAG